MRTLHGNRCSSHHMPPNNRGNDLRPFAACLPYEFANRAVVLVRAAALSDLQRTVAATIAIGHDVMVMVTVVVNVRRLMNATGVNAVMVLVLRRQPVQTVPQQRYYAVQRQHRAGQVRSCIRPHGWHRATTNPRRNVRQYGL
jgi:hypothetical protein